VVPNLRVLARSLPEDKRKLVKWLRAHNEVVAVTGDGTNDAPALKAANVGFAMNLVGTDVAKNAAHILILDDNFASIVKSVQWGRCVYDNIRKFVQFQLTINVVALVMTVIGALAGFGEVLTPVQLLWINLIMDAFAALALATEAPTEALLHRKPYSPDAIFISPVMWRNIFSHAALQLAMMCMILFGHEGFFYAKHVKISSVHHYSILFNVFVWLQVRAAGEERNTDRE
jgi:calcium-translocating P-type ATPase